jgi:hypothetical protein
MDSYWGMLLIGWAPYLGLGAVALHLGGRYVRALERRSTGRAELADIQDRLLRLEEAVADVSQDVDRVAEGQSFTTRILAERAPRVELPPNSAR